jgi:AcrR family transcriptional regulator
MRGSALRKEPETPSGSDPTRAKLIAAAGEVFAESGFHSATVREICQRAGANVAAVNYYFRDKLGLYTEVLKESLFAAQGEAMQDALAHSKDPVDALRKFIHGILRRMYGADRPAWSVRIMAHEMAHPTPALAHVIDEALRPRYNQLREMIGRILQLPADHQTTRLCAHSVIGQVVHFVQGRPVIAILWPTLNMTDSEDLQLVANHITDFTLRNLRALARANQRKENSR